MQIVLFEQHPFCPKFKIQIGCLTRKCSNNKMFPWMKDKQSACVPQLLGVCQLRDFQLLTNSRWEKFKYHIFSSHMRYYFVWRGFQTVNLPRNYIASIAIDIKRMILGNAGKSILAKNKRGAKVLQLIWSMWWKHLPAPKRGSGAHDTAQPMSISSNTNTNRLAILRSDS